MDCNTVFFIITASFCAAVQRFKGNGKGGSPFKGCEKVPVLLHITRQLGNREVWQLLSLGLRYVKDRYHFVGGYGDFLRFHDRLSVRTDHGHFRVRVDFLPFLFDFVRGGGKYLDCLFSGLHMAIKFLFPLTVALYQIAALHCNQEGVVQAVIVKL